MLSTLYKALRILILMTVLTGIMYPLAITGIGTILFPLQIEGSLIVNNHRVIGSQLLGQSFMSDRYIHGRMSAVNYMIVQDSTTLDYTVISSGGSNLAPTSGTLFRRVQQADSAFRFRNITQHTPIDMLTVSGSGVDPHISPEAAFAQLDRIARARGISTVHRGTLHAAVSSLIEHPQWMVLGMPRINVLRCNQMLDEYFP